jgi:CRP-like cAMP-binding protein
VQQVIDFVSAFTKVSKKEVAAISGIIHLSQHEKNEVLIEQGSIPKRLAFIIQGAVRTYYIDSSGNENTIAFRFENEPLVPFESFIQQTPTVINAVTLEPTVLIWTSHSEFTAFLESFPKYEKVLREIISKSLFMQSEQMRLLRITSSRERYEMLCKLRPEVIQRVPLKHIASYLGMALETLSRVRAGKL